MTDTTELWSLTQTGNWGLHRLDEDGNGDFHTGAFDRDEEGTFNVVNELTALDRDLDGDTDYDDETVTRVWPAPQILIHVL
ncbi:MAG TPA: hypothetical protein PLU35_14580 [Phycisphaerales bacterium]|nr:hypothetical protein [Phycisphaerales bacterium]